MKVSQIPPKDGQTDRGASLHLPSPRLLREVRLTTGILRNPEGTIQRGEPDTARQLSARQTVHVPLPEL
jgi:hypothetical protein